MRTRRWLVLAWAVALCLGAGAPGQAPPAETNQQTAPAPLASKEEIVRQRIQRLEERMYRLSESLRANQPEQAQRLTDGLRRARELRLERGAEQVVELLRQDELAQAVRLEEQLLADLQALLNELLDEQADLDHLQKEVERLLALRTELAKIINRQTADREQTELQARLARELEELEAAIESLERLRSRQEALAGMTGPRATRRQEQLSKDTRRNADQLHQPQAPPQEEPSARQQAADDLHRAVGHMHDAAQMLLGDSPQQARADQQSAIDKLDQAIDRLTRQAERLANLDPQQLIQGQRETAEHTGRLAEQMQKEQTQAEPGQQAIQQAGQHMQQALQHLGRRRPAEALPEQEQALDRLEEARRHLDETLEQLRREQHEEVLAALEVRLATLLAREQEIYEGTVAFDGKPADQRNRQDELLAADLARQQSDLADQAGRTLFILQEEASTVAFPMVLGQVQQDMIAVARRLADRRTGPLTQQIEQEIIASLSDLLAAVQHAQDQPFAERPPAGRANPFRPPPLLPASAELKLLRASQVRVNDRTKAFNAIRTRSGSYSGEDARQLAGIAERQEAVSQLARQLLERGGEQP